MRISLFVIIVMLQGFVLSRTVFALRPFVTTDADVVSKNEVEIELGLFGLREQSHPGHNKITLEVPAIRFNYGLPWDSEIVLETVGELIDSEYVGTLGIKEKQFANTAASYKKVWWRSDGGNWVPNFATETGCLFPTEKGSSGANPEGTGIFSWYLKNLTCHVTLGGGTARDKTDNDMLGVLLYGIIIDIPVPQYKKLHFVSEYSGEKTESSVIEHQLLGGFVWEGSLDINYDIAGFTSLNSESTDWGMTMGITFLIGSKSNN